MDFVHPQNDPNVGKYDLQGSIRDTRDRFENRSPGEAGKSKQQRGRRGAQIVALCK